MLILKYLFILIRNYVFFLVIFLDKNVKICFTFTARPKRSTSDFRSNDFLEINPRILTTNSTATSTSQQQQLTVAADEQPSYVPSRCEEAIPAVEHESQEKMDHNDELLSAVVPFLTSTQTQIAPPAKSSTAASSTSSTTTSSKPQKHQQLCKNATAHDYIPNGNVYILIYLNLCN